MQPNSKKLHPLTEMLRFFHKIFQTQKSPIKLTSTGSIFFLQSATMQSQSSCPEVVVLCSSDSDHKGAVCPFPLCLLFFFQISLYQWFKTKTKMSKLRCLLRFYFKSMEKSGPGHISVHLQPPKIHFIYERAKKRKSAACLFKVIVPIF